MRNMESHCSVCAQPDSSRNPVANLTEARLAVEGVHNEIELCRNCLATREVKSWALADGKGRSMHEAMENRPEPPFSRFTYLEDPKKVHLVRMRPSWLSSHAAQAEFPRSP